jgi:hypothetical protein
MRWFAGLIILLCVCAVAAGIARIYHERLLAAQLLDQTTDSVTRLQRELAVRSATKTAALNERGYPTSVDPAWFKDAYPSNLLLPDDHPWLEIAGEDEAELLHPSIRVATSVSTPSLWYNPYLGVIRARVPVAVSDEESLAAYNRVNGSSLPSLFWKEPRPVKNAQTPEPQDPDDYLTTAHPPRKQNRNAQGPFKRKKNDPIVVVHRPTPPPQTASAGE